jgi:hypothetical protein
MVPPISTRRGADPAGVYLNVVLRCPQPPGARQVLNSSLHPHVAVIIACEGNGHFRVKIHAKQLLMIFQLRTG